MNNKAVTLSLVMAVLAVFFVQSYVSSIEEEARKKFGTEVLVLKAKKDIKEQDTINETALELTLVPKRYLEPSSVYFEKKVEDKETSKSIKALAGSIAIVPIKKGEQITFNKITEPSIRTGLSPQVAPGKRAISIPVTEVTGVSKLVKPGDRIDLLAVIQAGNSKEQRVAKTILQDVGVLAVGKNVTNNAARVVEFDAYSKQEKVRSLSEDTSFTTLSIEVDPQQAQALALIMASSDNQLMLSLRNNDDSERVPLESVTMEDILGPDMARAQRGLAGAGGRR